MTISTQDAPVRPSFNLSSRISATALLAATFCALTDLLTNRHVFALVAAALVLVHVATRWRDVRTSARAMLFAAGGAICVFELTGGTIYQLALATSLALYLPALLAVMAFLRVATQRSHLVERAAHFVIDQRPSRRFLFLATGSHIFGILLNIGGLQLLLGIALEHQKRRRVAKEVGHIQTRRISNAVLRGFGATLLWSPVGVAINILMPLMHHMDWFEYAPYGLGLVAAFIGVGWLFDQLEPRPKRLVASSQPPGALLAVCAVLSLLIAITSSAASAEALFGLPLRAAVLAVIPLMATIWVLLTEPGPASSTLPSLTRDGFATLPRAVNEVCLIGSTGLLGLVLAQMIPPQAVQVLVNELALGHGMLACCIIVTMTVLGFVGLSPMISGTILVSAILAADIGMPEPMLVVSALCGWAGAMMLSPVTATVAIASEITARPSAEVGTRWNGAFTCTFLALIMVVLLVWDQCL